MSPRMEKSSALNDTEVRILPYRDEWRVVFERLNREWIEAHFVLEDADREIFRDPRAAILSSGGEVFFVVEGDQVLATCAVIRHSPEECEIAKMAVSPEARGRGFGDLLMERAIAFAESIGARRMIIVSNTVLQPAIRLYQKHGFTPVPLTPDPRYRRANIRLERELRAKEPVGRPAAGG
jgi:GNAT superfamily N-acetyltransferase